jgi:hypothetical protein
LRQFGARLERRELSLCARDLGLERARVDREQQVALADRRAVGEVHLVDGTGDARSQLDHLGGFEAAAELLALGDGALHRGRHADRRRALRWPALGLGRIAAAGDQRRGHRARAPIRCQAGRPVAERMEDNAPTLSRRDVETSSCIESPRLITTTGRRSCRPP